MQIFYKGRKKKQGRKRTKKTGAELTWPAATILEQLYWQLSTTTAAAVMAFLARSAASLLKSSRTAPAILSAARLYSSGTGTFQGAPWFRFKVCH